jgi:ankyrin repeat protein
MEKVDTILAACKVGDIDGVERLIKADATLATASTMLGSQPIHAAYLGGHGAIVELLLSRGVQIDFFLASELGMLDRVKQALDTDQKLCNESGQYITYESDEHGFRNPKAF